MMVKAADQPEAEGVYGADGQALHNAVGATGVLLEEPPVYARAQLVGGLVGKCGDEYFPGFGARMAQEPVKLKLDATVPGPAKTLVCMPAEASGGGATRSLVVSAQARSSSPATASAVSRD